MRNRSRAALVAALVVALAGGAFALTQQTQHPPKAPLFQPGSDAPSSPKVITGEDVGFRIDGYKDGLPVGRVVVKIDGKWVEPLPPPPTPRFAR